MEVDRATVVGLDLEMGRFGPGHMVWVSLDPIGSW